MKEKKTNTNVYKFKDLPIEIQDHFIKMYYACIFIVCVGAVATFFTKFNFSILASTLIIGLIIAIPNTYNICRCLEGNIEVFEGICVDVTIGKNNKRSFMTIRTEDDCYIQIVIPKKSSYAVNNLIALYCPKNSVYQKTPDSGIANSYYLIHKIRTDGTNSEKDS